MYIKSHGTVQKGHNVNEGLHEFCTGEILSLVQDLVHQSYKKPLGEIVSATDIRKSHLVHFLEAYFSSKIQIHAQVPLI